VPLFTEIDCIISAQNPPVEIMSKYLYISFMVMQLFSASRQHYITCEVATQFVQTVEWLFWSFFQLACFFFSEQQSMCQDRSFLKIKDLNFKNVTVCFTLITKDIRTATAKVPLGIDLLEIMVVFFRCWNCPSLVFWEI